MREVVTMKRQLDLFALQRGQLEHDRSAHADILLLPVQRRITHMTLHYAKYTGTLAQQISQTKLIRTLVDAFIISLASANALNLDLRKLLAPQTRIEGDVLLAENALQERVFRALAKATGDMAKACESLDHLESFDYRGVLEANVIEIVGLLADVLMRMDIDAEDRVRCRWREVEQKSVFGQEQAERSSAAVERLRQVC